MENNIPNQGVQQQFLPPPPAGASIVGEGGMQPQIQQPINPNLPPQNSGATPSEFFGSINWLEVAVYAAVVTFLFVGINYYRNQNKVVNDEMSKQSDRITKIETEITDILTPHQ